MIVLFPIIVRVKVKVKSFSPVRLFATPWTVAYQAPPSMVQCPSLLCPWCSCSVVRWFGSFLCFLCVRYQKFVFLGCFQKRGISLPRRIPCCVLSMLFFVLPLRKFILVIVRTNLHSHGLELLPLEGYVCMHVCVLSRSMKGSEEK